MEHNTTDQIQGERKRRGKVRQPEWESILHQRNNLCHNSETDSKPTSDRTEDYTRKWSEEKVLKLDWVKMMLEIERNGEKESIDGRKDERQQPPISADYNKWWWWWWWFRQLHVIDFVISNPKLVWTSFSRNVIPLPRLKMSFYTNISKHCTKLLLQL